MLLSFNGCNKAKLAFRDDDWDSLALEQRANDKEVSSTDQMDLLELCYTRSPDTNRESTHSQSSEFEDSIDCAFLNETYSVHYSESKLKNESLIHLSSELDSEMQKGEGMFFDILEYQGTKIIGLERTCKISGDDYKETAEDVQKHDMDEDSQQDYHSAEEQEYISTHLSFDQTKTWNVPNLEVVALRNSGYEVACPSSLEGNHVKLESNCSISLDSIDVYGQEDAPRVSKFQNSIVLREYHEPKHELCTEQETSLLYHTVFDEVVLESSLLENQDSQSKSGFLNPQKTLKTKTYTGKMKCQIIESKDFCRNAIVEKKKSHHLENPSTSEDKSLQMLLQPCKDCQTPWTSIFDDSVISASGYSHYKSLQNTSNPALDFSVTLQRIAVKDNQAVEDVSLKVANGSTTSKTCFHDTEGAHPKLVTDAANRPVAVNQTVDVSTDFRACFTTSRATSARSSVASTSSNTEITMINKKWPGEWPSEKQRSVACNTDWSCSQDDDSAPGAATEGSLGKSLSVDSSKPNGNFLNKVKPI